MDEIVTINREALLYDTDELVEQIFANSVSRKIFPVIDDLAINQRRFVYHKVHGDLKTNLRMSPNEYPENHSALQPVDVKVPLIGSKVSYNKHEVLNMNSSRSKMSVSDREMELMKQWAVDEDMYAAKFVDNVLDASASNANARAHRIHAILSGMHGYLGP